MTFAGNYSGLPLVAIISFGGLVLGRAGLWSLVWRITQARGSNERLSALLSSWALSLAGALCLSLVARSGREEVPWSLVLRDTAGLGFLGMVVMCLLVPHLYSDSAPTKDVRAP
ncbi:hypothetical protein [Rhodobacter sp. KR11]|uniref:hypothetical protein n=1 Tax=Rhodobacter sp. KR11 TaxID=2974588 RepID=UPI002221B188|nr:hypothetical protein [Rhodobacter sp. KR11]